MYSGATDPARWVLPSALREQAASQPERTWITTTEGESFTFAEAWHQSRQVASWFRSHGVQRGEHVALMAGNGLDFVRAWMGLGLLGAVAVLLNTELQGRFLEHQLRNSGARLILADPAALATLGEAARAAPQLQRVAVLGPPPEDGLTPLQPLDWSAKGGWANCMPLDERDPLAHETACIMYTSGTTGPAKGVLMPHAHCALFSIGACEALQLRPEDRYYIVLPLFHANGLLMQLGAALVAGIPAVLRTRFSAGAWLDDIRRHRATVTNTLGVLGSYILAQPASPEDRDHRLRLLVAAPNPWTLEQQFRERFGIPDVVSGYGMTEVNICAWGRPGHSRPHAAGWTFDKHYEVIVADPATDVELPRGSTGEILVRPRTPFAFMQGYHDMPERTADAVRNLWFHTGDAGFIDADGVLTFVDRIKDCIRRRGENISAAEVEAALATVGMSEVAAYAVPSDIPGGEDEVMLAIVASSGHELSAADVLRQVDERLPRFARPRYVKFVQELPRTASGKVQRALLRQQGTTGAFDRDHTDTPGVAP